MELIARLNWVDLAILVVLVAGVLIGFTQGIVRYLLSAGAVFVAFVLAAQLKGPLVAALGVWEAFTPAGRELLLFVLLFFGFVIGGWFLIRSVYRKSRLPIARQLDELGGAVFGFIFVVLLLSFHLVVFDSLFRVDAEPSGWVGAYYMALNDSVIVRYLRDTVIPAAGFLVRPFVPQEIAQLLVP